MFTGNIFKTIQEAERERDKRELLTLFRQFRETSAAGIGSQIGTIFTKEDTIFIYTQTKVNVA